MRKIVRTKLQAQPRSNEVIVERVVAELLDDLAELLKRPGFHLQRHAHFDTLAEKEWFKGQLLGRLGMCLAIVSHNKPQVIAQPRERKVLADVNSSQTFSKLWPVA